MSQDIILPGLLLIVLVFYIAPMAVLMWNREPMSITVGKLAKLLREEHRKAVDRAEDK